MKHAVKVGDDFEGISCDLDVEEARRFSSDRPSQKTKAMQQRTVCHIQFFVVKTVMLATIGVVATTGLYGLLTRDWSLLATAWAFAGPAVGAIISRYVREPKNGRSFAGA